MLITPLINKFKIKFIIKKNILGINFMNPTGEEWMCFNARNLGHYKHFLN